MNLYAKSRFPVATELGEVHARCLFALGVTGTWWTARQRAALTAEVRAARVAAGVAESDGEGAHHRALSLVPAETRDHLDIEQVQYLPLARFADYGYRQHAGLSRAQVEMLAGPRVGAE